MRLLGLVVASLASGSGVLALPGGDVSLSAVRDHFRFLGSLTPVPCREDLCEMAENHFKVTGVAAEIGVFQGGFAQTN